MKKAVKISISSEPDAAARGFLTSMHGFGQNSDRRKRGPRCFFLLGRFCRRFSLLLRNLVVRVEAERSDERRDHRQEEQQRDYFVDVIETHGLGTFPITAPDKATVVPFLGVHPKGKNLNQVNHLPAVAGYGTLKFACAAVTLVSINLTLLGSGEVWASPEKKIKSNVSGWVTPWDEIDAFEQVVIHKDDLSDVWFRTLSSSVKQGKPDITFTMPMVLNSLLSQLQIASTARRSGPRIGTFLHNATDQGFDPALGSAMVNNADDVVRQLRKIAREQKLRSINIDLESLAPSDKDAFSKFVETLADQLGRQDGLRVSVALHAQLPGQVAEHAKFQEWQTLAKANVDVTVMAYDYSWSTSEPGFVAPIEWVESVAKHALATFGKNKVVIALPAYGYVWRKAKDGWQGVPEVTRVIEATPRYKAFNVVARGSVGDGRLLEKDGEHLGYETADSTMEKVRRLSALGVERFAIWRLGGEPRDLLPRLRGSK